MNLCHYLEGCDESDVRLIQGSTSSEGRVEICQENVWASLSVCNYQEATYDRVICRQLGFSTAGEHFNFVGSWIAINLGKMYNNCYCFFR